jgi:hypothetical protein
MKGSTRTFKLTVSATNVLQRVALAVCALLAGGIERALAAPTPKGGLTLPYSGSTSTSAGTQAFTIINTGEGNAIFGSAANGGPGLFGQSNSGAGVYGFSRGGYGVWGSTPSSGPAIFGQNTGSGIGVYGLGGTSAVLFGPPGRVGVWGDAKDSVGVWGSGAFGVVGEGVSSDAIGVEGSGNIGVRGSSEYGYGVEGDSTVGIGVYGTSNSTYDAAVVGYNGQDGPGLYGESHSGSGLYATSDYGGYAVYAGGDFAATGSKSFIEPHPSDPTKEIRYVCLEGPETGTYFRGTGRIVNGFATIPIPDHFRMVTAETGLTVVAMPVGGLAVLAAVHQGLDRIVIQGSSDVEFNYIVNGIRKAFQDFEPVTANRDFVPTSAEDDRLTKGLPAESLRRLKATGILNEDGTINLDTAHRLGWDRRDSWIRAEEKLAKQ